MVSAVSSSSSSAAIDPWDQPPPPTTSRRTARPPRDDWEDDEDDDDDDEQINPAADPVVESNKKLWEDANSKPSAPMPSVILSPSATTPIVAPPLGAFQPTMQILKRPSPASNSNPASGTATPVKDGDFKEREKRYLEARERIFGADKDVKGNEPSVKVIREPKGPSEGEAKGFGARRTEPPAAD